MSGSIVSQTLYPPQSIFSEVQAIHDTGVYYRDSENSEYNKDYSNAVSLEKVRKENNMLFCSNLGGAGYSFTCLFSFSS